MKILFMILAFFVASASAFAEYPDKAYVKIFGDVARDKTPSKASVKKVCPVFNKWAEGKKDKIQALVNWDQQQCSLFYGRVCDRPDDNYKKALVRSAITEHCGVKND